MDGTLLRVLIVEDSEDDTLLVVRELKKGGYAPHWKRVDSAASFQSSIDEDDWDLILSDYNMPGFTGHDALRLLNEFDKDIPFIVISGFLPEEAAVDLLKAGAKDFVVKGNWARLLPAIARELEETKTRRERAHAEFRYQELFENAVDGIFQTHVDGQFLVANPALARIMGYDTPEELIANISDIRHQVYVHPERRNAFVEELRETGRVSHFEAEIYRKDGQVIWVEMHARALRSGKSDNPNIIEGMLTDVTERKKAEQALEEMNRQLEHLVKVRTRALTLKAKELKQANARLLELDKLKTSLMSSISHELRTPLTSILGFAKLTHKDLEKHVWPSVQGVKNIEKYSSRIDCNLEVMVEEGERLHRLINDFLDLSKIESGQIDWNDTYVDSLGIIRSVVQSIQGQFAEKPDVSLRLELPEHLQPIWIDPDRLKQVLINLLNNAIKFTDSGEVAVVVHPKGGDFIHLEVRDTGMGIPEDERELIFDKFHQVRPKSEDNQPRGTGLGLNICKQIVEYYKGRIWVESSEGAGSAFIMELPVNADVSGADTMVLGDVEAGAEPETYTPPSLLVVESDSVKRSQLCSILSNAGYRTLSAEGRQSAMDAVRECLPDLIALVRSASKQDSIEFIRNLRDDADLSTVPILVVPARNSRSVAGVAPPPRLEINKESLLDAVGGMLGRASGMKRLMVFERRKEHHPCFEPYFALCRGIITPCNEADIWKMVEEGFDGTIILPFWAMHVLDVWKLLERMEVQVLFLPDKIISPME